MIVLLERFLKDRQHIAIVVDEHGGTDGLVTLEDLIETIMGMEIMDETDDVEDMRSLARNQWKKRATALGIDADIVDERKTEQANAAEAQSRTADGDLSRIRHLLDPKIKSNKRLVISAVIVSLTP